MQELTLFDILQVQCCCGDYCNRINVYMLQN